MALLDATNYLGEIFGEFSYIGPFVVLLLCGVGLPIPEEVTLIGSGLLVHSGKAELVPIIIVCSAAILIGDSIPYWLGRRYGLQALQVKWVARFVAPARFIRLKKRFEEHGNWATFACRFFAGVRIPGYFVAGTMGMSYLRFVILDGLGILISVPISIYLGKVFGGEMDKLHDRMEYFHLIVGFLALSLALTLFLRSRRQRALRRAAEARAEAASGGAAPITPETIAAEHTPENPST